MVVFMVFDPDRVEELGGLSAAERVCCLVAAVVVIAETARFYIGLDFHGHLLR